MMTVNKGNLNEFVQGSDLTIARTGANVAQGLSGDSEAVMNVGASVEFNKELVGAIPDLFRFAMALTRNRSAAEDLTHDTITLGLQKWQEFTPGTKMSAWLFAMQVKSFRRRATRDRERMEVDAQLHREMAVKTQRPSQIDSLIFKEAEAAIEELPREQREVLFLIAYDGKSYEEAADILGIAVGTVKSRMSRARARIAEVIEYNKDDRSETRELVR